MSMNEEKEWDKVAYHKLSMQYNLQAKTLLCTHIWEYKRKLYVITKKKKRKENQLANEYYSNNT